MLEGLGGVGAITYKQPRFLCHCSDERVYRALRLLEKEEVSVDSSMEWLSDMMGMKQPKACVAVLHPAQFEGGLDGKIQGRTM